MPNLPPNDLTLVMWIGVLGKALVKKGVLSKEEIISELMTLKSGFQGQSQIGMSLELDNMISTVKSW